MEVEDALETFLSGIAGVECFTETLRFYAPTCYGECLDSVEKLARRLDVVFKGSTVYDAQGRFFNKETGRVEVEPVRVIEAAHHCLKPEQARQVSEAIRDYALEAKQSHLSITQNRFYLAKSEDFLKAFEESMQEIG